MIKSEQEYQEACRRLQQDQAVATQQRGFLQESGLSAEEVERAMAPLLSFQAQLAEEVGWYENVRRRNFWTMDNLTQIGKLLIALRIANNLTQRELAQRLGVNESQVSRDERNEYHGITVERAQRVLNAMGEHVRSHVADKELINERDLVLAD